MKDSIKKILEQIEKEEGVWEQNNSHSPDFSAPNGGDFVSPEGGLKTKFASIPRSTGEFLANLIKERRPKTIVEVGSSVGYSTLWLASAAEQIGARVYYTEINPERIEKAKQHFKDAGIEQTIKISGDAGELLRNWHDGKIDFAFVDAFKKDYQSYLELLLPLMNVDGLVVFDNVGTHAKTLAPFLEKIGSSTQLQKEFYNRDNGLLALFT